MVELPAFLVLPWLLRYQAPWWPEHVLTRHDAEELALLAQLHMVVRGRRGGRAHPPAVPRELRPQRPRLGPGQRLEDARLVQGHSSERPHIEVVQAIVVADVDTLAGVRLLADHSHGVAPAQALSLDLAGYGEWGQDQRHAVAGLASVMTPFQLARRLAKEAGIDLSRVTGSGPHGRVVARDIAEAKSGKGLKPAASAGAPAASTGAIGAPAMSDQQILALYDEGAYESVPHDSMRRTIAQRLTAATNSMPTFYLTVDCDLGKLASAREEINAAAGKDKDGKPLYKLSVNDFVIKAMALALQKIPEANVSWTEAAMLRHKHSDIGVAVALPFGLITPIIRQAEIKTLSAISNEMKDLAARAKGKKLKPNEYQGGTSSVSNLGMYGIKDFTAVINPPQSSILAVGTSEERAVVRNGQIVAATMMSVTLSCDHRAVDGALGAELIGAFKTLIENPVMMVV